MRVSHLPTTPSGDNESACLAYLEGGIDTCGAAHRGAATLRNSNDSDDNFVAITLDIDKHTYEKLSFYLTQ